MSNKTGNNFFAFLLGALVGGITGILYAPDKGSNTRGMLVHRLEKYKNILEQFVHDMVNEKNTSFSEAKINGQNVINEAKMKAEKLLDDVDDMINQIKESKTNVDNN